MIRQTIEEKLFQAFSPSHLDVQNESYRHNVPAGAESHFKVIIVSEQFTDQSFLARHRSIYSILGAELAGGVHALALHTYTPKEWAGLQDTVLSSPDCRGAGLIA